MSNREALEGEQCQGVDEQVIYDVNTLPWGGSPTSPSFKVFSVIADVYTEVTGDVSTGSPTVSGDAVILPAIGDLTLGVRYRVEVQFNVSGASPAEAYFYIRAER